ncbi:WD domain, G-beta repeat-containing protein [Toxoplasma gondii MAS]|uniref:WD domain, G-beta repeat-containing protein n=1 Tax=Toxoplasma gondii MAS TaxID=943118 RepID=A0A086QWG9_TOXGO|nr:WD domain, G-beta repeat-containing protein [Toxoplasma gondii MAS]
MATPGDSQDASASWGTGQSQAFLPERSLPACLASSTDVSSSQSASSPSNICSSSSASSSSPSLASSPSPCVVFPPCSASSSVSADLPALSPCPSLLSLLPASPNWFAAAVLSVHPQTTVALLCSKSAIFLFDLVSACPVSFIDCGLFARPVGVSWLLSPASLLPLFRSSQPASAGSALRGDSPRSQSKSEAPAATLATARTASDSAEEQQPTCRSHALCCGLAAATPRDGDIWDPAAVVSPFSPFFVSYHHDRSVRLWRVEAALASLFSAEPEAPADSRPGAAREAERPALPSSPGGKMISQVAIHRSHKDDVAALAVWTGAAREGPAPRRTAAARRRGSGEGAPEDAQRGEGEGGEQAAGDSLRETQRDGQETETELGGFCVTGDKRGRVILWCLSPQIFRRPADSREEPQRRHTTTTTLGFSPLPGRAVSALALVQPSREAAECLLAGEAQAHTGDKQGSLDSLAAPEKTHAGCEDDGPSGPSSSQPASAFSHPQRVDAEHRCLRAPLVAVGYATGTVLLVNLFEEQVLQCFQHHSDEICALAFLFPPVASSSESALSSLAVDGSPHSASRLCLLAGSRDGQVSFWDLAGERPALLHAFFVDDPHKQVLPVCSPSPTNMPVSPGDFSSSSASSSSSSSSSSASSSSSSSSSSPGSQRKSKGKGREKGERPGGSAERRWLCMHWQPIMPAYVFFGTSAGRVYLWRVSPLLPQSNPSQSSASALAPSPASLVSFTSSSLSSAPSPSSSASLAVSSASSPPQEPPALQVPSAAPGPEAEEGPQTEAAGATNAAKEQKKRATRKKEKKEKTETSASAFLPPVMLTQPHTRPVFSIGGFGFWSRHEGPSPLASGLAPPLSPRPPTAHVLLFTSSMDRRLSLLDLSLSPCLPQSRSESSLQSREATERPPAEAPSWRSQEALTTEKPRPRATLHAPLKGGETRVLWHLHTLGGWVNSLSVSPSSHLLVGCGDATVRVVDLLQLLRQEKPDRGMPRSPRCASLPLSRAPPAPCQRTSAPEEGPRRECSGRTASPDAGTLRASASCLTHTPGAETKQTRAKEALLAAMNRRGEAALGSQAFSSLSLWRGLLASVERVTWHPTVPEVFAFGLADGSIGLGFLSGLEGSSAALPLASPATSSQVVLLSKAPLPSKVTRLHWLRCPSEEAIESLLLPWRFSDRETGDAEQPGWRDPGDKGDRGDTGDRGERREAVESKGEGGGRQLEVLRDSRSAKREKGRVKDTTRDKGNPFAVWCLLYGTEAGALQVTSPLPEYLLAKKNANLSAVSASVCSVKPVSSPRSGEGSGAFANGGGEKEEEAKNKPPLSEAEGSGAGSSSQQDGEDAPSRTRSPALETPCGACSNGDKEDTEEGEESRDKTTLEVEGNKDNKGVELEKKKEKMKLELAKRNKKKQELEGLPFVLSSVSTAVVQALIAASCRGTSSRSHRVENKDVDRDSNREEQIQSSGQINEIIRGIHGAKSGNEGEAETGGCWDLVCLVRERGTGLQETSAARSGEPTVNSDAACDLLFLLPLASHTLFSQATSSAHLFSPSDVASSSVSSPSSPGSRSGGLSPVAFLPLGSVAVPLKAVATCASSTAPQSCVACAQRRQERLARAELRGHVEGKPGETWERAQVMAKAEAGDLGLGSQFFCPFPLPSSGKLFPPCMQLLAIGDATGALWVGAWPLLFEALVFGEASERHSATVPASALQNETTRESLLSVSSPESVRDPKCPPLSSSHSSSSSSPSSSSASPPSSGPLGPSSTSLGTAAFSLSSPCSFPSSCPFAELSLSFSPASLWVQIPSGEKPGGRLGCCDEASRVHAVRGGKGRATDVSFGTRWVEQKETKGERQSTKFLVEILLGAIFASGVAEVFVIAPACTFERQNDAGPQEQLGAGETARGLPEKDANEATTLNNRGGLHSEQAEGGGSKEERKGRTEGNGRREEEEKVVSRGSGLRVCLVGRLDRAACAAISQGQGAEKREAKNEGKTQKKGEAETTEIGRDTVKKTEAEENENEKKLGGEQAKKEEKTEDERNERNERNAEAEKEKEEKKKKEGGNGKKEGKSRGLDQGGALLSCCWHEQPIPPRLKLIIARK